MNVNGWVCPAGHRERRSFAHARTRTRTLELSHTPYIRLRSHLHQLVTPLGRWSKAVVVDGDARRAFGGALMM